MSDFAVLRTVTLKRGNEPTGRTVHREGNEVLPPPTGLAIVQYPEDSGFYLLYLDAHGQEMTDTYHETIEGAMSQAEFEFNVRPPDWETAEET